jgi:CheY-like chemotaxis protein
MRKILIIDDNPHHRLIYRTWIENFLPGFFEVLEADNQTSAYEIVLKESPVCILLDYHLNGGDDGFTMLHQMKRDMPDCPPIIFLTCALTERLKRNVMALGAQACFEKSTLEHGDLVDAIKAAI